MNLSSVSSIPFIDFGGSGTPIHFAHDNSYPPACSQPLFSQLSKNYHVISMLQRPLWQNNDTDEIKDWQPFTTDQLAFRNQQHLNPSIAIGYSLEGISSLRAAILEPDRFKTLVLIDPLLFYPILFFVRNLIWSMDLVDRFQTLIKATRFRRWVITDTESIFKGLQRTPVFRYMDDDSLWAYVKGITISNREGGYSYFSAQHGKFESMPPEFGMILVFGEIYRNPKSLSWSSVEKKQILFWLHQPTFQRKDCQYQYY